MILNGIPFYLSGDLKPEAQKEEKATYTRLFKKEDGSVNFDDNQTDIERKIRAFNEWPKVTIEVEGKRIQLISAHFEQDGELVIDSLKPEGKNEMSYDEYLRGRGKKLTFKP